MSEIPPLQVKAALAADDLLAILVGTRIHHATLPDSPVSGVEDRYPCIVFFAITHSDASRTHDGHGGWERPGYQFDCWGADNVEAWEVAEALKAAVRGSVLHGRITAAHDLNISDLPPHRVVVDAQIWTSST